MSVIATAVTDYGGELLRENPVRVLTGALDEAALARVMTENRVTAVIDATHPYAGNISRIAADVTASLAIKYIRYLRPVATFDDHPLIYRAATWAEAAELAMEAADGAIRMAGAPVKTAGTGKTVFLTIGSKNLRPFVEMAGKKGIRVVARVLPDPGVLAACLELGLKPRDIIACQGPFGEDLNRAMLAHYRAGVLVTKDSGAVGGTEAKLAAAKAHSIPVVLVERPPEGNQSAMVSDIKKLIRMVSENDSGDNHTGTRE
jgi:precorrin-6x reductase